MESGREFAARVFIDASYEGDVMARAGVKYIVGREPNSLYGETLNGALPFTPAPFPKVSPYVVPGDPKSGLLPRVEPKPPGPKGSGDHRVQAYNFRVCLTDVPENRVPLDEAGEVQSAGVRTARPAHRHHEKREARPAETRRDRTARQRRRPGDQLRAGAQPQDRLQLRRASSARDMFGASYGWAEADYAGRAKIFQQHKDYTLGLLWFLGHDERLPAEVRDEMQPLGSAEGRVRRYRALPAPTLRARGPTDDRRLRRHGERCLCAARGR